MPRLRGAGALGGARTGFPRRGRPARFAPRNTSRGSEEKIMAGKLAEELWAARVAGSVVELAPADEPASAAAAYEVQAAMVRLAGLEPVGWKIGATTEATQALLAVD